MIIFLATYFVVVSIIDRLKTTSLLEYNITMSKINGIYLSNIIIYIDIKTELSKFLLFEKGKQEFLIEYKKNKDIPGDKLIEVNNVDYTVNSLVNGTARYYMKIPRAVETSTFENINDKLLEMINIAKTTTLNDLYFSDACFVFFNDKTTNDYIQCSQFWGKILPSGITHGVNQLVSSIQSVLDLLNMVNSGTLSWEAFLLNHDFSDYERFIELYLYRAYKYNKILLDEINKNNLVLISDINIYLMFCYMVVSVIVVSLLSLFIGKLKNVFTSLLNFIGIIPSKHVIEDQDFLNHILTLDQYISF